MNNSKTTLILGVMFLLASSFYSYGVNIICSSIFFFGAFYNRNFGKIK